MHDLSLFFFATPHTACRILVPLTGMEPVSPAVEVWHLNHWTAREVPCTITSLLKMPFYDISIVGFVNFITTL